MRVVARANEVNRTEPKTSLPVRENLGRAFLVAERLTSPLETGTRKADLADVLASSRTADADDVNIARRGTCLQRSGGVYASADLRLTRGRVCIQKFNKYERGVFRVTSCAPKKTWNPTLTPP